MKYRAEIDGLRAVAVVPVVLFHAGYETFSGGYVGVDVFFVISGFLITSILLAEFEQNKFSLRKFYERRARRILPALFTVMAVCLPVAWVLFSQAEMKQFARSVLATVTFSSNILFWKESGYFDLESEVKPLLHTWSLAVEEQYYILFPLFLMVAWRFGKRVVTGALAAVFIGSLLLAQWGSAHYPSANFYLLPSRAWELLIGAFAAILLSKGEMRLGPVVAELLSACGFAAILGSIFLLDSHTPFPSFYTLLPTLGAVAIILAAQQGTRTYALLSFKPIVFVGLISYSLYLWHQPILVFGRYIWRDTFHAWAPALLVATVGLSLLSYYLVERPMRFMVSTAALVRTTTSVACMYLVVGIVLLTVPGISAYSNFDKQWQNTEQILEEISAERATAIFHDECHFTGRTGATMSDYLRAWQCTERGHKDDSVAVPVAVAGDSNAADIANAFRQNGMNPANMSGAGCSLVPSLMRDHCRLMFDQFIAFLDESGSYEVLVLTNLFTQIEYDPIHISELIDYWSQFDGQVVLLLDTPRFPDHYHTLRLGHMPQIDLSYEGLSIGSESIARLEASPIRSYSRNRMYCAINACSYYDADNRILIADRRGEHLSLHGARLFGGILIKALKDDGLLQ